jgi:predicted nucleotidyltransferase
MPGIASAIRLDSNCGEIDRIRERALGAFLERLKNLEGENLLRVVLFGSVARGDAQEDSDVDVFVLVEKGTRDELDRIVDIATDTNMDEGEYKIYLAPFIRNKEDYVESKRIKIPLYRAIDEEGIVLYDAQE